MSSPPFSLLTEVSKYLVTFASPSLLIVQGSKLHLVSGAVLNELESIVSAIFPRRKCPSPSLVNNETIKVLTSVSGDRHGHTKMKKYRYGDPTKISLFKKYGNFLYFFAAWNLLGIVVWKSMSVKKKTVDETWDEKTSSKARALKLVVCY